MENLVLNRTGMASLAVLAAALVFAVALGFVLAFQPAEANPFEERWSLLGVPEAEFVFLGEFTRAERKSNRQYLKRAQVVLAQRFGAVTSDFTVYLSTDLDLLNERRAVDRPGVTPIWFTCGGAAEGALLVVVLEGCPELKTQGAFLAHEYFHILQQDAGGLASRRQRGPARPVAWLDWLVEGSAVYASALVSEARGRISLDVRREGLRLIWAELAQSFPRKPAEIVDPAQTSLFVYQVGFLATDWLAERAGPEAVLNFFRFGGHPAAFETAFGLALDDFYAAFEEYRLEVAPPFAWRIAGTVLGSDGLPVEEMEVIATVRIQGQVWAAGRGETDSQGAFEFMGPGSGYTIWLGFGCPRDDNIRAPFVHVGEWGADGFVADESGPWEPGEGAQLFLDGERNRTGMVIQLPETRESLVGKHCEQ